MKISFNCFSEYSSVGSINKYGIIMDIITPVNCYIDPLIYVIWYRETKLELLKVAQTCLPGLKPKIQKMQTEIYNIQIYSPNRTNDKLDKLIWNNYGLDNSGELLYIPTNLRDKVHGNKSELLKVVQTCLPGLSLADRDIQHTDILLP